MISDATAWGCGDYRRTPGSAYYVRAGQRMVVVWQYGDLLILGVVVLFLAAAIVLEVVEYWDNL